jgi:hypothetical protein
MATLNRTKVRWIKALMVVSGIFLVGGQVVGETLSNVALYHRCYAQLTQSRPDRTSTRYQQVRAGTKNAIAACLEVLSDGELRAGTGQLVRTGADSLAVLKTFQDLHMSWFFDKSIPDLGSFRQNRGTASIYDSTAPALYFTRALFTPSLGIDNAVMENMDLQAIRTVNSPTTFPLTTVTLSEMAFPRTRFVSLGELQGIREQAQETWQYSYANTRRNNEVTSGNTLMYEHRGGGFLGSQSYLMATVNDAAAARFKSDGGLSMPRRWARSLYEDALCRPLPVIRRSDTGGFVTTGSAIPFRTSASCVRCHASMDRTAGVIRNFRYLQIGGEDFYTPRGGAMFPSGHPTNLASLANDWPPTRDTNYAHRPNNGVLYYRNYKGVLRDIKVNSLAQLGTALAGEDDFYICAAKRYYEYFTGINVTLSDPSDPETLLVLSPGDRAQRDQVIAIGLRLKNHKNPMQTIQEILSSDIYKKSDFNVPQSALRSLANE